MPVRIHPFHQSPILTTDRVCGPSAIWHGISTFICLTLPTLFLLGVGRDLGGIGWIAVVLMYLMSLLFIRRLLRILSGSTWIVRYNPQHVLIRLGEVFETDPDALAGLEIAWSDVEWARSSSFASISNFAGETQSSSSTCLQLKLRPADLTELAARLADVSKPKVRTSKTGHSTTTVYRQVPVTLSSDGILSIEFQGQNSWISPSTKTTLRQFAQLGVTVLPEISEVNDFTRSETDNKKLDDEILRLAQAGQTLDAIKLTRKRYGYSLTQARQFVQDLLTPAARLPAASD